MSAAGREVAEAALELREAGELVVGITKDLATAVAELAVAESRHRIACNRAGVRLTLSPRELAADVALAALAPLRPSVPFVSELSAARSAEALGQIGKPAKPLKPKEIDHE